MGEAGVSLRQSGGNFLYKLGLELRKDLPITPASAGKLSGTRPRSIGVMKWGCGLIMPWDAPMAAKAKHR
jgi:hypothetical protein